MATIQTVDTSSSGDTASEAFGKYNTTVENLNTDKIEADSADTLTNKTIDADGAGNSISNIDTTNIKATAKTGQDTDLATGTAGVGNNLAMWNTDGDLVDSTFSTKSSITGVSTTDFVPEGAIVSYINTRINSLEAVLHPYHERTTTTNSTATGTTSGIPLAILPDGTSAFFTWKAPTGMTGISSVKFICYPDATETITGTLYAYGGATGEAIATLATEGLSQAVTATQFTDVEEAVFTTDCDAGISSGDHVTFEILSSINSLNVHSLVVTYSVA